MNIEIFLPASLVKKGFTKLARKFPIAKNESSEPATAKLIFASSIT